MRMRFPNLKFKPTVKVWDKWSDENFAEDIYRILTHRSELLDYFAATFLCELPEDTKISDIQLIHTFCDINHTSRFHFDLKNRKMYT